MGKQTGPDFRTGTIGPVTYYKLFGEHYYLRSKSSLDGKRFARDPAFARSRKRSKEFGGAASLASKIYKLLPKKNRGKGFMGKFIGRVHLLLMDGYTPEAIQQEALREYGQSISNQPAVEKETASKQSPTASNKALSSYWVVAGNGRLQQKQPSFPTTTLSGLSVCTPCAPCRPPT